MGGRVIVAEQVGGGVEVLLGAVRDPGYGAVVVAGVGGGTAEALDLAAAALAPLDLAGAERLVRAVPALARLVGDPSRPRCCRRSSRSATSSPRTRRSRRSTSTPCSSSPTPSSRWTG